MNWCPCNLQAITILPEAPVQFIMHALRARIPMMEPRLAHFAQRGPSHTKERLIALFVQLDRTQGLVRPFARFAPRDCVRLLGPNLVHPAYPCQEFVQMVTLMRLLCPAAICSTPIMHWTGPRPATHVPLAAMVGW